MMTRRKKLIKLIFGILLGIVISQMFLSSKIGNNKPTKCGGIAKKLHQTKNVNKKNRSSLLFVGVMTAAHYLPTRARAVYETWGGEIPGRIVFFSSEHSHSNEIPLVALKGVDDSYPPQKKSFQMLKYMHDHYLDKFEWFMRADDDVYVKADKLERFLRSVDSRKAWFIGQTGRGNSEEFGLLSLESDENFCMGGPGVIMSRETLKRVAPFVNQCLGNLVTNHEDVELGRCIRRFAGISCTWSYEASLCACKMQVILYHNQSGQAAFSGDLKQKEVHRAITLHPVKQPEYMYKLHKYIKGLKVQDYQQEMIDLHRDIAISMSELGFRRDRISRAELVKGLPLFPEGRGSKGYLGDTNLLGVPLKLNRFTPKSIEDVLEWELISKTLYSHKDLNPRKRIGSSLREGLKDIIREIMELINSYSKQRGRIIDFNEILYGYYRLDPIHGVDLILDLLLVYRKYRGHKMTVQVRRHAYLQQTFTGIFAREIQILKPTTEMAPIHEQLVNQIISTFHIRPKIINPPKNTINFILPLSGRFEIFRRFLKIYENICIKAREPSKLIIILYKNDDTLEDYKKSRDLIENLNNLHRNVIKLIIIENEKFARAKALAFGVESLNPDDLILFIDVDIIFDSKSLARIRRNTKINENIYFPIVYSLYNPKPINTSYSTIGDRWNFNIDNQSGFWRQFGFGIAALFKVDYLNLGGLNVMISGWGFEDVTFFDNAVKSDLRIVRRADPSLIHVYHSVDCDTNLDSTQKSMCLGTQASTLASLKNLQKIYQTYEYLFR